LSPPPECTHYTISPPASASSQQQNHRLVSPPPLSPSSSSSIYSSLSKYSLPNDVLPYNSEKGKTVLEQQQQKQDRNSKNCSDEFIFDDELLFTDDSFDLDELHAYITQDSDDFGRKVPRVNESIFSNLFDDDVNSGDQPFVCDWKSWIDGIITEVRAEIRAEEVWDFF
jgi:hypothetical protein